MRIAHNENTLFTIGKKGVFIAFAEIEALEPMLSENIIKLQIADNHILSTIKSKSKSF